MAYSTVDPALFNAVSEEIAKRATIVVDTNKRCIARCKNTAIAHDLARHLITTHKVGSVMIRRGKNTDAGYIQCVY